MCCFALCLSKPLNVRPFLIRPCFAIGKRRLLAGTHTLCWPVLAMGRSRRPGTTLAKIALIAAKATGLKRTSSNPAFMANVLCSSSSWPMMPTIFVCSESRNLAKSRHQTAAIHARHYQVDQHQIGPKYGRNVECRRPTIGHMHLVSKFFNDHAPSVPAPSRSSSTTENPEILLRLWHRFPSFRQSRRIGPWPES